MCYLWTSKEVIITIIIIIIIYILYILSPFPCFRAGSGRGVCVIYGHQRR